jgi:signal transduction histidine kinase
MPFSEECLKKPEIVSKSFYLQYHSMLRKKIPFPLKTSFLYLVFGVLWILFSDKIVFEFIQDPYTISELSLYKGWFFIIVTALLLFFYIRKETNKRNQLINQLQEANKKANESDLLKTAFLGNLSHYIRTPMNSILGFAELLEQRNIDAEKRSRFYSLINQQSQHLLYFINNIVDISKIQSGQLEVSKKYFHMNPGLRQLYKGMLLDRNDKQKDIELRFEQGLPDGEDVLFSDEERIKHILTNLLANAINYTEKGEVVFGYVPSSSKIVFYITDTGPGLPDRVLDNLFKGFVFSVPSEIKVSEGFGLGLYLSHGLVKLLNGELWLENTSAKGSKFCFSIPREP